MTTGQKPGGKDDLAARFRRLIRSHGPMPVSRFMGESNAHYYTTRDPLGADGDFTTAPEISQMFGEMAGLWLADMWMRAGSPGDALYVEMGPGRGTLARDGLRVMARQELEPAVHLVEGSAALRQVQQGALAQAQFHDTLADVPETGPLLLVANEFLDALPIRQLVRTSEGWRECVVGLEGDNFVLAAGSQPMDSALPPERADAPVGTIIETCPAAAAVMDEVIRRLMTQGGAALFIDYGHLVPRTGSSLQAVRNHQKVGPLAMPGEADLTAHVDFAAIAQQAARAGVGVAATTQGRWLAAMGIGMRAEALTARFPDRAAEIAAAHDRLAAPDQMGDLFKVMALVAPGWPMPAGFAPA